MFFPKVRLTFTSSADTFLIGQSVLIAHVPFIIGRSSQHMSIKSDDGLSREHCAINWDGGSFTIADLGSTNGTYLNGRRVLPDTAEPLMFGASIRLSSSTVLTFVPDEVDELPDLSGQLVNNRYTLVKLVRASMKAALYEAKDENLFQKAVAVKLLSPSLATYPGYLQDFKRQAQMAASINHPHVCRILDHGATPFRLRGTETVQVNYLCMDLLSGGNLADRLLDGKPIALEKVTAWLGPITDALDDIHCRGVIHCGLKPTSIVLDANDSPYVTDFAIASSSNEIQKHVLLGAPDFIAPEQWDGHAPTAATDQYALATLTYLMLTGTRPYESQRDPEIRQKNFARGPVPAHEQGLRAGVNDLPKMISEVLKRALFAGPKERYPSVREFYAAFQGGITKPESSQPVLGNVGFELKSGQIISHYKIVARIGAGGMGVVFKARDLNLPRDVALKFLNKEVSRGTEGVARLRQEARFSQDWLIHISARSMNWIRITTSTSSLWNFLKAKRSRR